MTFIQTSSVLAALVLSASSFGNEAGIEPLKQNSPAYTYAEQASSVNKVINLRTDLSYRFADMNTALNGDMTGTTMLLVGEEVGGEAGFEYSFQLTPVDNLISFVSAKVVKGKIIATFYANSNGYSVKVKKAISFDRKTEKLIMTDVK